eukprot:s1060_g6.t1
MEGGERLPQEEQRMRWRRHLADLLSTELRVDIMEVPSLCELENACRGVALAKASGLDEVPSDVCRRCPSATAKLLYSLMLKAGVQGQEALGHKGGFLIPIWKGKQSRDECAAFRSILLSSSLGKVMHKSLRSKQMTLYEKFLHPQQIGGRVGVPVVLGSHTVRAFQRLCAQSAQPSALLFIDLQEAFYRVLRPLVVDGPISDELLAVTAHRIGLDSGFLHDLHLALDQPCALLAAQLPEHLRRALRALHTDTFFQLPGQRDLVVTQIGSRPGDSFADVIYGYLMARVLKDFTKELQHRNILFSLPVMDGLQFSGPTGDEPREPFVGPCWMDDLCICLCADTNTQLQQVIGVASGTILDLFKRHAMTPNLKPGKTALLVSPKGPGTKKYKEQLFGPASPPTLTVLGEHHTYQVPIVRSYTHLGGQVHFSSSLQREIKMKLAVAHQAFNKHRKLLYQSKHFDLAKKRQLFESLVLSRLLYGSETWVFSDAKTSAQFHGGVINLYKRLLGLPPDLHAADDDVLFQVGMLAPLDLLRQRRLRYLGSLFAIGSTAHWGLLNQDGPWLRLLQEDLAWVWQQLHHCSDLGDPREHLPRWLEIIQWHRSYWKRLVRRACMHAVGRFARDYHASTAQLRALTRLADAGWVTFDRPAMSIAPSATDCFGCMSCQLGFRSRGGEGAHMNRVHGIVNPVRHLIGGTQCSACLKEYYTHGKLKMHLIRSGLCRRTLIGRRQWEVPQPGLGSAADEERRVAWDNRHFPIAAQGPLPQPGVLRDFDVEHRDLFDQIALLILDHPDLAQLELLLRELICSMPISWTQCRSTLDEVMKALFHDAEIEDEAVDGEIVELLTRLRDPQQWAFLCRSWTAPVSSVPSLSDFDNIVQTVELVIDAPIPRPVGRERVFLHAFSGRRRPGDLQHYLEAAFARDADGLLLHVVSMDVVIDERWGDARNLHTQRFWLEGVLSGYVLGGLCGPPCETWSQARFAEVDSTLGKGPRPVRSAEALFGLTSLSLRELLQVTTGNDLLLFSLDLLVCLAIAGGCGVLEHPSEPTEQDRPSIWKLAFVQLLMQLPGFDSFTFAQGLLGARTPKPTRLLTVNMPSLPSFIHRHRICPDLPRRAAIGQLDDATWATTGLKEYPPALNRAFGECFCHHFLERFSDPHVIIPPEFLNRCRAMHVPHKFAGRLIGIRGEVIRQVRDAYGVRAALDDCVNEPMRKLELRGHVQAVQYAKQHVELLLLEVYRRFRIYNAPLESKYNSTSFLFESPLLQTQSAMKQQQDMELLLQPWAAHFAGNLMGNLDCVSIFKKFQSLEDAEIPGVDIEV